MNRRSLNRVLGAVVGCVFAAVGSGCSGANLGSSDLAAEDVSISETNNLRSLTRLISSETIDDEGIEQAISRAAGEFDLVAAAEIALGQPASMVPGIDRNALIFALGKSGDARASAVLLRIADGLRLNSEKVSEVEFEAHEVERLFAISALRDLGRLDELEMLYEIGPVHLKSLIRGELSSLDSERWPVDFLPQEYFSDLHYDPEFQAMREVESRLLEAGDGEELVMDALQDTDSIVPPPPNAEYSRAQFQATGDYAAATPPTVFACGVSSVSAATSQELWYSSDPQIDPPWCNSTLISEYWNGYSFNGSWDSSMGWNDPCNLNFPLGRTLNAIHLLHTAAPVPPSSYNDFSGDFLRWAGNYARREIPSLRASCATDVNASTNWAALKKNRYVTMKQPSFYDMSTAARAAVIIHEARHTERCSHNGNDGSNRCCSKNASCDESWNDGCDGVGSPSGAGGTGWQVRWLQWYLYAGTPVNSYQRSDALQMANFRLIQRFDEHPGFTLTQYGGAIAGDRPACP